MEVRDIRRQNWLWMSNAIIDKFGEHIGAYGIATYAVLCRYANADGVCWPSIRTIAKMLDCSPTTVQKTLDALEKSGLIRVENRTLEDGRKTSNRYYLLPVDGVYHEVEQGVSPDDTRCTTTWHRVYHEVEQNYNYLTKNIEQETMNEVQNFADEVLTDKPSRPSSFDEWIQFIRSYESERVSVQEKGETKRTRYKNPAAALRIMAKTLIKDAPDESWGIIGKAVRLAGGPERVAQLLWEMAPRPPVGGVFQYIVQRLSSGGVKDGVLPKENQEEREVLARAFTEYTRIPRATGDTIYDWDIPLQSILEFAGGDVQRAKRLMREAIDKMRSDKLSIVTPKSVMNIVRSLVGENSATVSVSMADIARLKSLMGKE